MEWVSAKECAGIPGMPTDVHKARAKLEQFAELSPEKKRKRERTKAFEFHISLLPAPVQAALLRKHGKVQIGGQTFDLPKPSKPRYAAEAIWARWNKAGSKAQETATARLKAVQAVYAMAENGVGLMAAYATVAAEYNIPLPTLRRYCGAVKGFDKGDWAPVLLPKQKEGAMACRLQRLAHIDEVAWEAFKADYLRNAEPTFTACYERLKKAAKKHGWVIPSLDSLERRLKLEVPAPQIVMLRKGEHAMHQMYPPQERTVADLHAMQWINGDGYLHNVFVKWFNGEILRPKTWFWQDVASRKIIGWRTDVSENTDSIRLSLMDVFQTYGIPQELTIDNTRAAANKWLTGGVPNRYRFKVKPDDPLGLIPMFGIKLHWSSVILGKGHGQAKPIERAFGRGGLEEYIDKHPSLEGAYTGPNPMAKPDNYGSKVIDAEVFLAAVEAGIEMYNAKQGRETEMCRGVMSFDDAFAASYEQAVIRKATPEQLQLLMLQAEATRVSAQGTFVLDAGGTIQGRSNRYFHDALFAYAGQKVVARFDPASLHDSVVVYTLQGLQICTAECLEKVGFGDTHAAREHKRKRTQFVKANKLAAQAKRSMSAIEAAQYQPEPETPIAPESRVVAMVRPVSVGNTALKVQQPDESEFEQRYSDSIALMREQAEKRRL